VGLRGRPCSLGTGCEGGLFHLGGGTFDTRGRALREFFNTTNYSRGKNVVGGGKSVHGKSLTGNIVNCVWALPQRGGGKGGEKERGVLVDPLWGQAVSEIFRGRFNFKTS